MKLSDHDDLQNILYTFEITRDGLVTAQTERMVTADSL